MSDELFASPKSRTVTMLLAFFLGVFGVHRFYTGKVQSGVLMARPSADWASGGLPTTS